MTFEEWVGRSVMLTFAGTGVMVIGACLVLGSRELLRRLRGERRVERSEFERKKGLGL